MSLVATFHIGRVKPQVGKLLILAERAPVEVGRLGVEGSTDTAHLVLAEPVDAKRLGHPLDLSGGDSAAIHLRHGGHKRAISPGVALDHILREETTVPHLWYPVVS